MSDDNEKEEISGTVFADAWLDPDIDMSDEDTARIVLEVAKNVNKRKNDTLLSRNKAKFSDNLPEATWKAFLFLAAIIGAALTVYSKG